MKPVSQVLGAAAAQVTGKPQTEAVMLEWAKTTDSIYSPGNKMYLDENIEDGIANDDAVALIERKFGVTVVTTKYAETPAGSAEALSALEAALAQGKAVMVGVDSKVIWAGVPASQAPSYTDSDHVVVVISLDAKNGTAYLNDSGLEKGAGKAVPIDTLIKAWAGGYKLYAVSANSA